MLVDGSQLSEGSTLTADVCIAGGGAAGITVARELRESGLDVLLLEAGGFDPDAASQALYEGEMVEPFRSLEKDYLSISRLRYFGGTTNHWAGWCRPLDELDMEPRACTGGVGWPFPRSRLSRFYRLAYRYVDVREFRDNPAAWFDAKGPKPLKLSGRLTTRFFHFSKPTRFGTEYRQDLVDAPTVRVLLKAAVVELRTTPDRAHVDRAEVVVEGRRITVKARAFVLAAGGLENPRLLLSSTADVPEGLGNAHDQVGRWFMDHPGRRGLHAILHNPPGGDKPHELYAKPRADSVVRSSTMAVVTLTDEAKREEQLPNGCFLLRKDWKPEAKLSESLVAARRSLGGEVTLLKPAYIAEPLPTEDSRVTLTDERDALGLRKLRLHWKLHGDFPDYLRRIAEIFAVEMGRDGVGRIDVGAMVDENLPKGMTSGRHHMGTTRMHDDPRKGVVDADCRVHGLDNLFVAGSSVFPTAGYANPTLTIVALAIRLSRHLEGVLV